MHQFCKGEWFWYGQALFKPSIFLHIYCSIRTSHLCTSTPGCVSDHCKSGWHSRGPAVYSRDQTREPVNPFRSAATTNNGSRKRIVVFHRINGYVTLSLISLATVGGSIVARRAFGGELNVQSGYYVLSSLIILCAGLGIYDRKEIRKHRKWMLSK
jgi:hypothetical protein